MRDYAREQEEMMALRGELLRRSETEADPLEKLSLRLQIDGLNRMIILYEEAIKIAKNARKRAI